MATSPTLQPGTMPGQYDRYNMRRQITLTANVSNTDLGHSIARSQSSCCPSRRTAHRRASRNPRPNSTDARNAIGLAIGLGLAIVAVFLLLTANFQSVRLALVAVSTAPAVIAGVL